MEIDQIVDQAEQQMAQAAEQFDMAAAMYIQAKEALTAALQIQAALEPEEPDQTDDDNN